MTSLCSLNFNNNKQSPTNEVCQAKGGSDGTPGEHESVSLPKEQADSDHVCESHQRKIESSIRYGFTEGDSGKPLCVSIIVNRSQQAWQTKEAP